MCGGGSVKKWFQPVVDAGTAIFAPEALPAVLGTQAAYDATQGNWLGAGLSAAGAYGASGGFGTSTDSAASGTQAPAPVVDASPNLSGAASGADVGAGTATGTGAVDPLAGSGAVATPLASAGSGGLDASTAALTGAVSPTDYSLGTGSLNTSGSMPSITQQGLSGGMADAKAAMSAAAPTLTPAAGGADVGAGAAGYSLTGANPAAAGAPALNAAGSPTLNAGVGSAGAGGAGNTASSLMGKVGDWASNNKMQAGLLGIAGLNAINTPKLPSSLNQVQNSASGAMTTANNVINSGGTGAPQWQQQKSAIDAQIAQQLQSQSAAIKQSAANSGQSGMVVQQQINALTQQLEATRQQQYAAAQQQNVSAALNELSGSNSALTSIGNTQLGQSQAQQQTTGSLLSTAAILSQLQGKAGG